MGTQPGPVATPLGAEPIATPGLTLRSWRDRAVVAVAAVSLMSGFGEFGVVAALGSVAAAFGQVHHGATIADQAGLSGTELGAGLAVIRLASLGGLPVAASADRFGRRRVLLTAVACGLALTALAAASPGYWWFVAVFAVGRPLLSATNTVAGVSVAELTGTPDRAKAVALVAAGYGVGAGIAALAHSLVGALGFRGLFALAAVPLAAVPLVGRQVREPGRFVTTATAADRPLPILGAVGPIHRRRLGAAAAVAFATAVVTGPATGFIFLYAQNVRREPGGVIAGMVLAAGVAGLLGLLTGRWMADRLGRRPACAIGIGGLVACAVLTYSGSGVAMVVGYVTGVGAGSVLAPALGTLVNEAFPTEVRASAMGWSTAAGVLGAAVGLLVFGAVADLGSQFRTAALVTFAPVVVAVPVLWLLPEVHGREPEAVSDQRSARPPGAGRHRLLRAPGVVSPHGAHHQDQQEEKGAVMAIKGDVRTGAPCWIDLSTADLEAGSAFYAGLFGWEADQPDAAHGGYVNFRHLGSLVAGAMPVPVPGMPARWTVYLASDDLDATVEVVRAAGGEVYAGPHRVDGLGAFAVVADPAGSPVGFWQPGTHRGFGRVDEAGAPCWFHLATPAFASVTGFYQKVTGAELLTTADGPEMRQVLLRLGDRPVAGIMDVTASNFPAGQPTGWLVVFGAADVDAAVTRAVGLGGTVLRPAEDSPYGRLAVLADPEGAPFSLVAAPEGSA